MGPSLERTLKHKTRLIILALSLVHSLEDLQKKVTYFKSAIYMPTTLSSLSRARITSSSR